MMMVGCRFDHRLYVLYGTLSGVTAAILSALIPAWMESKPHQKYQQLRIYIA